MRFSTLLLVFLTILYGFHVASIGGSPAPATSPALATSPASASALASASASASALKGHQRKAKRDNGSSTADASRNSDAVGEGEKEESGESETRRLIRKGANVAETAGKVAAAGLGQGALTAAKGGAKTVLHVVETAASPVTSALQTVLLPVIVPLQGVEVALEPVAVIVKTAFKAAMEGLWKYEQLTMSGDGEQNGNDGASSRRKRAAASEMNSSLTRVAIIPFNLVQQMYNTFETGLTNSSRRALRMTVNALWKFMRTDFLPWLHSLFEELMKSNVLPQQLQQLVGAFDSMYDMLKLLGYVK